MNLLHVYDADGRLVRTDLTDGTGTIDVGVIMGSGTVVVSPMDGHQLNGHLHGCRCAECRPDLYVEPFRPYLRLIEGGGGE